MSKQNLSIFLHNLSITFEVEAIFYFIVIAIKFSQLIVFTNQENIKTERVETLG